MSATEDDIRSFQEFAMNRISQDGADAELEDLLDEWRRQNPGTDHQQQDLLAIKAAVTAWDNGDLGRPADDVLAEIRAKHGL
jgi:hypothetical protein